MKFNIPKGTRDVLPSESHKWHYIENVAATTAALFGAREIRTPVFEHTELFLRGVGETTDIVNKEMYTFTDRGGRSLTLKPEGTAGVARSFVENLESGPLPVKTYYITPVFRYERPQAGRFRQHHQFGVEFFGSPSPAMDAEVIGCARTFLERAGLPDIVLYVNSIGCPECRKAYNEALRGYYASVKGGLCKTCLDRLERNPLRILDCKNPGCMELNGKAPKVTDFLCPDCAEHYAELKNILSALGISYREDPGLVRGLDYYTRTVFEFKLAGCGPERTVCGGGRYDNLVEEAGGKPCPAVGFGLGLERLISALEERNVFPEEKGPALFLACAGEENGTEALKILAGLRRAGIPAETDFMSRSLKSQMKYAEKIRSAYVAVLGSEEIKKGTIEIRNMSTGETESLRISDLSARLGSLSRDR